MSNPIQNFQKNIEAIDVIGNIYQYMEIQVQALDLTEILRAQFVLLVSALDAYVHDKVNEGVLNIFEGKKTANNNYNKKLNISLEVVHILLNTSDNLMRKNILDIEIRKITNKQTFQSPNNIENALQLIDVKDLWRKISKELKIPPNDITRQLSLIVHRRNKIAHESDMNPATNAKNPIDKDIVRETKDFLSQVVFAIEKISK